MVRAHTDLMVRATGIEPAAARFHLCEIECNDYLIDSVGHGAEKDEGDEAESGRIFVPPTCSELEEILPFVYSRN